MFPLEWKMLADKKAGSCTLKFFIVKSPSIRKPHRVGSGDCEEICIRGIFLLEILPCLERRMILALT